MGFFRVAVSGESMAPTLREGDWLIAVRSRRAPRAGELVILRDPADPARLLVKRVASRQGRRFTVASEAIEHGAHFSPRLALAPEDVVGRPVLRYAPLHRFGPVR
ncbi:MAG: S24/S26 family peptidase [Candidatus Limnocylindria bacterium]